MRISQEAIEAAANHQRLDAGQCLCGWSELGRSHVEHQLSAAAAHIAAQALRDAAIDIRNGPYGPDVLHSAEAVADGLFARANEIAPTSHVHNHGPEEGPGLSCRENRQPDGSLKGQCLR